MYFFMCKTQILPSLKFKSRNVIFLQVLALFSYEKLFSEFSLPFYRTLFFPMNYYLIRLLNICSRFQICSNRDFLDV